MINPLQSDGAGSLAAFAASLALPVDRPGDPSIGAASSGQGSDAGSDSSGRRPRRDEVSISQRSRNELLREELEALQAGGEEEEEGLEDISGSSGLASQELTEEEEAQVRELQARDREVRAHEQAHKAAAGDLAPGPPRYETTRGPDGRSYAVGGEVTINLREGDTPEETVEIARRAQRAALAPAEPSPQDRAVAAQAAQLAAEAQSEIAESRQAELSGDEEEGENGEDEVPQIENAQPSDEAALALLREREGAYLATIAIAANGLI